MRRILTLLPILIALALAGCTGTAAPPLVTGSVVVPDARQLTSEDDGRSCQGLADELAGAVAKISALPGQARSQRATPPTTLRQAFLRATDGAGHGLPAHEEFDRLEQRIDGLARLMRMRGCPFPDPGDAIAAVRLELGGI